jgi:hypothetical protein
VTQVIVGSNPIRHPKFRPCSSVGLERFPPKEEVVSSSLTMDTRVMRETTEYPPFQIRCSACNKEPGQPCSRWEGAPCACMARVEAAEAIFGKFRYKDGKYVRV